MNLLLCVFFAASLADYSTQWVVGDGLWQYSSESYCPVGPTTRFYIVTYTAQSWSLYVKNKLEVVGYASGSANVTITTNCTDKALAPHSTYTCSFSVTTNLYVNFRVRMMSTSWRYQSNDVGPSSYEGINNIDFWVLPAVQVNVVTEANCEVNATGRIEVVIVAAPGSGPYVILIGGVVVQTGCFVNTPYYFDTIAVATGFVVEARGVIGCSGTSAPVFIPIWTPPVVVATVVEEANCLPGAKGTVKVRITSGVGGAPYKLYLGSVLLLENATVGRDYLVDVAPGVNLVIKAVGTGGCVGYSNAFTMIAWTPPLLTATVVSDAPCNASSSVSYGVVKIRITGGFGAAPYSIWRGNVRLLENAVPGQDYLISTLPGTGIVLEARGSGGCVAVCQPFTIVQLSFTVVATPTLATCANNKTGSIVVVATGLTGFNIELTTATSSTVLYAFWDVVSGCTFTGVPAGNYVVITTHISSGCVVRTNVTVVAEVCHPPFCALSHGYWKNHYPSPCPPAVCASFCGLSPQACLSSPSSSGNAIIIAGRQFIAFVFNHYFYNLKINIRTLYVGAPCPAGLSCDIWQAYLFLNTMSRDGKCASTSREAIISAAALLDSFNSHTTYTQCNTSGGSGGSGSSKGKSK